MRAALPPVGVEHPDEDQLDTHRRYIEGMRKFAVGRWTSSGVPQDTVNVWNANHAAIDAPAYRYIIEPVATFEEHTRSRYGHTTRKWQNISSRKVIPRRWRDSIH